MENYHDPIRHLKYLRQSLSQDNEPIGFFIAAGCPLSVKMQKEWPLIPDVKNLTLFIKEKLKDDEKYTLLLDELAKAEGNTKNIEDILSFLRNLLLVSKGGDVRGLCEDDLLRLEKKICEEIVEKLHVFLPNKETPYHHLCKWISWIDRKTAVELFTTNYDLLIEQALEDLDVPYFDGFVGSRRSFFDLRAVEENLIPVHWSRLWKIHGSINWHQEVKEKEKRVFRSSEVKKDASHLIYPSHLKYEESRKMPYLALIDQLNRFIRKKSSFLILSGYSFNDEHLNDTILNALRSNPTAMVLGLMYQKYYEESANEEPVERYKNAYRLAKKQHNLNIWTYDKAIIGTNFGSWKRSSSEDESDLDILHFVSTETQSDNGKEQIDCLVKLGDFSQLTDFLKKIIGTPKGGEHV